jgi:hypothetical protein
MSSRKIGLKRRLAQATTEVYGAAALSNALTKQNISMNGW